MGLEASSRSSLPRPRSGGRTGGERTASDRTRPSEHGLDAMLVIESLRRCGRFLFSARESGPGMGKRVLGSRST